MSKGKKLIWMIAGVILLVAAVICVMKYNEYQASLEPEESSSSVVLKNLFENDKEDIASINVVTKNDSFTLIPGDRTATGELNWKMEEHPDWELNNIYSSLISMASKFQVYKEIDTDVSESRLAEFGLADPSSTVTITLKDGTQHQVLIGDLSSDQEYCFCMMIGDDTIYACNSTYATYATYTQQTLRLATITSIDTEGELFTMFVQKKGERPIEFKYIETEEEEVETEEGVYLTSKYQMVQPYDSDSVAVMQGITDQYFKNLTTPTMVESIDVSCTDFEQYGLGDEPEYRETIVTRTSGSDGYEYKTTDYVFGYTYGDKDQYIYFREADSDHVMGVEVGCMDVRQFDPFFYVNKLIYLEPISDIQAVSVTYGKETHSFEVKRGAPTEDSSAEQMEVYRFDGELIDSDTVLAMYRMLISIGPDYEILNTTPEYDSEDKLEFTVTYNDGSKDTITYYRLSEFYYVTEIDENTWFACGDTYIDKLAEKLDACVEAISDN